MSDHFTTLRSKGLKLIHKINLYILLSLPRVTINVTRTRPTIIMLQKIKFYSSFGKNCDSKPSIELLIMTNQSDYQLRKLQNAR